MIYSCTRRRRGAPPRHTDAGAGDEGARSGHPRPHDACPHPGTTSSPASSDPPTRRARPDVRPSRGGSPACGGRGDHLYSLARGEPAPPPTPPPDASRKLPAQPSVELALGAVDPPWPRRRSWRHRQQWGAASLRTQGRKPSPGSEPLPSEASRWDRPRDHEPDPAWEHAGASAHAHPPGASRDRPAAGTSPSPTL